MPTETSASREARQISTGLWKVYLLKGNRVLKTELKSVKLMLRYSTQINDHVNAWTGSSARFHQMLLINSFDLFRIGRYQTHTFPTAQFYNFMTTLNKPVSEILEINKNGVCILAKTHRFLCKSAEQSFFFFKGKSLFLFKTRIFQSL